jgi:hypothetical protein
MWGLGEREGCHVDVELVEAMEPRRRAGAQRARPPERAGSGLEQQARVDARLDRRLAEEPADDHPANDSQHFAQRHAAGRRFDRSFRPCEARKEFR